MCRSLHLSAGGPDPPLLPRRLAPALLCLRRVAYPAGRQPSIYRAESALVSNSSRALLQWEALVEITVKFREGSLAECTGGRSMKPQHTVAAGILIGVGLVIAGCGTSTNGPATSTLQQSTSGTPTPTPSVTQHGDENPPLTTVPLVPTTTTRPLLPPTSPTTSPGPTTGRSTGPTAPMPTYTR